MYWVMVVKINHQHAGQMYNYTNEQWGTAMEVRSCKSAHTSPSMTYPHYNTRILITSLILFYMSKTPSMASSICWKYEYTYIFSNIAIYELRLRLWLVTHAGSCNILLMYLVLLYMSRDSGLWLITSSLETSSYS